MMPFFSWYKIDGLLEPNHRRQNKMAQHLVYPPPLTREEMRGLKAAKEEKERQEKEEQRKYGVYRSVMGIYSAAHKIAESGKDTRYIWPVPLAYKDNVVPATYVDMIIELHKLFPECSVELTVKDTEGSMRVVTNMDLSLVFPQFIVIDWS